MSKPARRIRRVQQAAAHCYCSLLPGRREKGDRRGRCSSIHTAGALTAAEDARRRAAGAEGLPRVRWQLAGVAAGAAGAVVGSMTVCEDGTAATGAAAAAAAQCSEIMLSSVTAKLLSAAPELTAPLALCPVSFTSWPTCGLRSTLLVVILKI